KYPQDRKRPLDETAEGCFCTGLYLRNNRFLCRIDGIRPSAQSTIQMVYRCFEGVFSGKWAPSPDRPTTGAVCSDSGKSNIHARLFGDSIHPVSQKCG